MAAAGRPILLNHRAATRPTITGVERWAAEVIPRLVARRPEWGVLEARNSGTNQRGELVFSMVAIGFVPRRDNSV